LTPLVRHSFQALGILDQPHGPQKIHTMPIPRVGGIAVVASYLASFALIMLLPSQVHSIVRANLQFIFKVLPAGILVFAVGLADDIWNLKPWQKLCGQVAAAAVAYLAGVRMLHIAEHQLPPWLSLTLTIFWLVGCTNAFNLIDGADGIAAGVGFFATLTTLLVAILQNHFTLQVATVPLAACLLAFLAYNFSPASIFLGDCGSLSIGFLLGCYGVLWVEKCSTLLGLTAPVIAFCVPLLDTWLAMARRFVRHRPLMGADQSHIHHQLLARGFTPRRVAITIYVVSGLAAAFALLISMATTHYAGLAVVVFCFGAFLGIRTLGYKEFKVAGRMLSQGKLWQMVNTQLLLENLSDALAGAKTADEWWQALEQGCREFGFQGACLEMAGRVFGSPEALPEAPATWSMCIPLTDSDFIYLSRCFNSAVMPEAVDQFVTILRRAVQARREERIFSSPDETVPVKMPTRSVTAALAGQ
jgi:UDP-GlcNAc:undecaprenyl-phosphate GlcNAc-1-phosphate transferase